jgi:hypothetical protein
MNMHRSPSSLLGRVLGIAAIGLLLAAGGCAMRRVTINSYAEPQAKFQLLPGAMLTVKSDNRSSNPILSGQIARKLEMALNNSGWRVLSGQSAPFIVTFTYGSNKGTESRSKAVTEPGSTRTVTTRDDHGNVKTKEVETASRTRYVQEQVTVYDLWLKVKVTEAKSGKAIWIGDATNRSDYNDIRAAVDYMIAALVKVFGQDSKHEYRLTITKDDPVVQMLIPATP